MVPIPYLSQRNTPSPRCDPSLLDDLHAHIGRNIPHHYNAGYIALSFVTSLAGCWTAVELLHRRSGSHGSHNWYLLLAAAMTMGAVAIWCMHYVGNRATIMCDGEATLAIQYSPGSTAGSFFLAVAGVGMAFYFSNISGTVTILGTVMGGTLMGGAICGMHYLGQVGIANYQAVYAYPYVTGAAIIAVTASTTALTIFFFFKSQWTNSWYRRIGCAILLATAVSGMHWCATAGTEYRLISTQMNRGPTAERVINVVTVLAICCCLILVSTSWLAQRSKKRSQHQAKQVVLSSVIFDSTGKLMVDSSGLLPCRKITNAFVERTFDEVFDTNHPLFSWIFRASRCWDSLNDFIPAVREHLQIMGDRSAPDGLQECHQGPSLSTQPVDYDLIFKELFCVAASDLATTIQQPLVKLGSLFDSMMCTGIGESTPIMSKIFGRRKSNDVDLESSGGSSSHLFGLGQLLFVVREAREQDVTHLQSSGFTFTQQEYVIDRLATRMQVPQSELRSQLLRMRKYAQGEENLEPGVHIAIFALKPLLNRGFDVLVRNDARNLLPSIHISLSHLTAVHRQILSQLEGSTISACRERFSRRHSSVESHGLVHQILQALTRLAQDMDSDILCDARLVAQPLQAPTTSSSPEEVQLIVFRTILDVHKIHKSGMRYEYVPLKLFITRQHCCTESPDLENFGQSIKRDFAHLAELRAGRGKPGILYPGGRKTASFRHRQSQSPAPDSLSETGGSMRGPQRLKRSSSVDTLSLHRLVSAEPATGNDRLEIVDTETFAERLVALTIEERKTRGRGSR